jgi:hypothetical protein
MTTLRNVSLGFSLCCAFGLALAFACEKKGTNSPDDDKSGNLCKDYKTCDECIAGQQGKGATKGEAETQCGAAVLGCWTTWDKPIVCGDVEHEEPPAGEAES